ncbi:predicted protein [Aspergillus terreus NIH2624]|uniref:FAD-binding domain-containing protein n=1 Tax=Aspergillus terreus (strain NIH 2624 / FGSC A1156) TaxID=341663 RepID=Q0CFH8_ASPTN|nr:uncharacterized protein ATEG_07556 [Aspergillus terreus NIH2624]EAU31818.1 predicted protein [Aspergillus terreus NIH2624]
MPREPYQRCSQAILEAWLKPKIQAQSLITAVFGLKFESLVETDDGVESKLVTEDGEEHLVKSQFVIGCDGAGSRVRRGLGIQLEGGPVPGAMFLIHFKSSDLTRLQTQGQFWHIYFTTGQVIISQDEKDTWTVHCPISLDADVSKLDPREEVYKALGGEHSPYPIVIDEILVTSVWRPNICVAERYASEGRRIFLAGDSAHQNIPTGGYGMNTAVGDSFDIGWKLAAVIQGHGGKHLLDSYELERRPVAVRNIDRSGVHWSVHSQYLQWCQQNPHAVIAPSEEGETLRAKIADWVRTHDGENKDHGIEMGYRYTGSNIILPSDDPTHEPPFHAREYVPTTWPGSRVPHVFLKDGTTSIYDLLGTGPQFTLVDFTPGGTYIQQFTRHAEELNVPFKTVHLPEENHVRSVWEREAVLVRPDDHVAWRASDQVLDARTILQVAVGQKELHHRPVQESKDGKKFTGTIGNVNMENVKMRAEFQV